MRSRPHSIGDYTGFPPGEPSTLVSGLLSKYLRRIGTQIRISTQELPKLPYLVLAAITLAVYWPTTGASFVSFDDPFHVTLNPSVRDGISWPAIKGAFHPVGLFQPITTLSYMLDAQLFGLNPVAFHLTNIWIHVGNTLLW